MIHQKIKNDKPIDMKEYRGQDVTEEFEIEVQKLSRWEN
jgi:hypothetical protein